MDMLRSCGCSGFQYGMMIEENGQGASDQVFESHCGCGSSFSTE
jgi:Fe-S cluster assembly iron-binding protein IscA